MLDAIFRIALLAAIFGSVFILAQIGLNALWSRRSHLQALNKRMRMIRQGMSRERVMAQLRKNDVEFDPRLPTIIREALRRFYGTVFGAGVTLAPTMLMAFMGVGFVTIFSLILIGGALAGIPLGAGTLVMAGGVATCISILLPIMIISRMAQKRRKRIEQQFPVALDIFVRALRAGHPVASAIELLTKEMEDPIGSEFGLVSDEVSYGAELTSSLAGMAERWDSDDMRMFVVSLSVQNETGGNLAEILQNLADIIRARATLYMKVRALSSEGRMTGWMLTVLPIITFVGMFILNPGFYLEVAQDSAFIIGAVILIMMYLIGFIMIRKLIDIKV